MTEAMPFLQKYDITFLRPPTIWSGFFVLDSCYTGGAGCLSDCLCNSRDKGGDKGTVLLSPYS